MRAAVFLFTVRNRSGVVAVSIAVVIVIVETVGVVVETIIVAVIRRLVEQAGARIGVVVARLAGRADVVDPGILGQAAAGLIAPRPLTAAKSRAVAKTLMAAAAHHAADA